jgi:hypothetical protein
VFGGGQINILNITWLRRMDKRVISGIRVEDLAIENDA